VRHRKPGQYWDKSANPIIVKGGGFHCTKISPGCANCWAEQTNLRFHNKIPYDNTPVEFELDQSVLDKISRRKIRTVYFMCDLMDYLHGLVPDRMVWDLFKFMAHNPQHIYLVLTKRADRFAELIPKIRSKLVDRLFHVKFGLTVCNQPEADEKISKGIAYLDWLSIEPMLGAIQLGGNWHNYLEGWTTGSEHSPDCQGECRNCPVPIQLPTEKIDWVILGGESGPGARPMHSEWVRSARDQCVKSGTPFYFKQWGEFLPEDNNIPYQHLDIYRKFKSTPTGMIHSVKDSQFHKLDDGTITCRIGKRRAGRLLDGKEWNQYPKDLV